MELENVGIGTFLREIVPICHHKKFGKIGTLVFGTFSRARGPFLRVAAPKCQKMHCAREITHIFWSKFHKPSAEDSKGTRFHIYTHAIPGFSEAMFQRSVLLLAKLK